MKYIDQKMCWVLNTIMLNTEHTLDDKKIKVDKTALLSANRTLLLEFCKVEEKSEEEILMSLFELASSDYAKEFLARINGNRC